MSFREDLQRLINQHGMENVSNTPDFILANFLTACLEAFDHSVVARDEWSSTADPVPHGFAGYPTNRKDRTELDCRCGEHFPTQEALTAHVRGGAAMSEQEVASLFDVPPQYLSLPPKDRADKTAEPQ